ncbi:MBL fold metallo-hydrolase [Oceanisphaera avium]|uniref:MBL fold metallo-hydrolase n=1 Tax=Oceanisphaera avium TaxID=1903694 RepID=A0A1Y0CUC3_9GAMM|nr:MBL fold metallo-hydrolase [Oceanisphaera avium]ART78951.1 MBL fold metallo-hydrolase [Oceanisphaera avium]
MSIYLCSTCGTSYPKSEQPPACCPICVDERQYVPSSGQEWTTIDKLLASHTNCWKLHEPHLFEIKTSPSFAIAQRAFLIQTPSGNILWDCISLLDPATEHIIQALGGLKAIAISHPHYYTTMQEWAQAFDAPVYLHEYDKEWVMREDKHLTFWQGDTLDLGDGLTLLRLGGHFPGGTVLHWPQGAAHKGVLMSGDIIQVAPDTRRVSFMWSYPNMLPLSGATVERMADTLIPWKFDRIYGAFDGKAVLCDAKGVIERSVKRYVELLKGYQD